MKGFKKDGKFIPTEKRYTKNSLKKKDLHKKTLSSPSGEGHEMRDKKTITHTLGQKNHALEIVDGKIEWISLGNMTDAGWYWSLSGQDARNNANTYLLRLAQSDGEGVKFVEDAEENGVSFDVFKKQIKENLAKPLTEEGGEDGIYILSGGNSTWEGGEEAQTVWEGIEDSYFDGSVDYTEKEQELVMEEAYMIDSGYDFKEYLETYGEYDKRDLLEKLDNSNSFEEYFDQFDEDYWHYDAREHIGEGESNHAFGVISKATDNLIKAGKIRKEAGDQVH